MEISASKRSAFDYATNLFLPTLSVVALVVLALAGKHTRLLWGLLVLAFFSLVVGFYPSLKARIRGWSEYSKDERMTKSSLPEFRRLVHRFEEFVDTRRPDTLHYIALSELCQGDQALYGKLGIPDVWLWHGFWDYLRRRVDQQRPNLSELRVSFMEFHHLVGSYYNHCVAVIFDRPPQDVASSLTDKTKRSFNSFQQRFERFVADYEEFAKELGESRPAFESLPRHLPHPKPL